MVVFQQPAGGFTLLEVLIALALLSLVAGALYGTFFSLTAGREAATAGMEARRELRSTLDLLRRELSGAFYNGRSGNKRLHFVVEDRDEYGKPASVLEFTAIAPPSPDNGSSDQVLLRYQPLVTAGNMVLTRQSRDLYLEGDPLRYPQMEELAGFLVECYDGSKWVKSWDTAINIGLPTAVRVTLSVKDGERTVDFATIATPRITGP
jgi:general secretion pathway protein J